jgi:hypothetical protein
VFAAGIVIIVYSICLSANGVLCEPPGPTREGHYGHLEYMYTCMKCTLSTAPTSYCIFIIFTRLTLYVSISVVWTVLVEQIHINQRPLKSDVPIDDLLQMLFQFSLSSAIGLYSSKLYPSFYRHNAAHSRNTAL